MRASLDFSLLECDCWIENFQCVRLRNHPSSRTNDYVPSSLITDGGRYPAGVRPGEAVFKREVSGETC